MRGTLPNTDQPRIPHLEYCHNLRHQAVNVSTLGWREFLPVLFSTQGKLFWPRIALYVELFFRFSFLRFFFVLFLILPFDILFFKTSLGMSSSPIC